MGTALATHVTLEDELLYPALRARTSRYDRDIQQQRELLGHRLLQRIGQLEPRPRPGDRW